MHVKKCIFFFYLSMFVGLAHAADIPNGKSGWNIGFMPFAVYNSDLGLQLGGLANVYYYGDGKQYPAYQHSWYAEISHFSKGSGVYRFFMIPNTYYLAISYRLMHCICPIKHWIFSDLMGTMLCFSPIG